MKMFTEFLREHSTKMINFKMIKKNKKEIINKRVTEFIWKCKNLLYLFKKLENKYFRDKKYCKNIVREHCHYTEK